MNPPSPERIFIGDVHGCAAELEDLLEAIDFRPATQRLWFVGDLVNRGPESARVLRLAAELEAESVLGNHDLHLLGIANGSRSLRPRDTVSDVLAAPDREALVDWLSRRPALCLWDDLVLVHAGLSPRWTDLEAVRATIAREFDAGGDPFAPQDLAFAACVRFCDARGRRAPAEIAAPALASVRPDMPPRIAAPWSAWDALYAGERRVVFGHWAQRGLVRGPLVRGLDSGCVWGGRLTAWIEAEDRFVSVPARRAYQEIA